MASACRVEPGVRVLNLHDNIIDYALNAEVERCITGNDFSVVVCADITNLDVAVFVKVLRTLFFCKAHPCR